MYYGLIDKVEELLAADLREFFKGRVSLYVEQGDVLMELLGNEIFDVVRGFVPERRKLPFCYVLADRATVGLSGLGGEVAYNEKVATLTLNNDYFDVTDVRVMEVDYKDMVRTLELYPELFSTPSSVPAIEVRDILRQQLWDGVLASLVDGKVLLQFDGDVNVISVSPELGVSPGFYEAVSYQVRSIFAETSVEIGFGAESERTVSRIADAVLMWLKSVRSERKGVVSEKDGMVELVIGAETLGGVATASFGAGDNYLLLYQRMVSVPVSAFLYERISLDKVEVKQMEV